MAWPVYFILAYLAVGLQVGLAPHWRIGGATPNFVLLCAVFIAVHAPREPALLGCFALGAMQDLVTADTLGLYALSYGLFALTAAGSGQSVYRGHPLTHVALTLMGGVIAAIVVAVHGWLPWTHATRVPLLSLLGSALYTAILAPVVLGLLHRMRRAFAFQPSRRRM
jgi:rod shape-determining protein MreD